MSVDEFEIFCKQAYEEIDPQIRNRAEQACLSIVDLPNCFEMCTLLLERGNSPYSQVVAISSLVKLINRSQNELSIDQRITLRNMCINYLIQREDLVDFVVKALIGLICRITKLGWLDQNKVDDYPFRDIIEPLVEMVKSGQSRPTQIGVQILYNLVYEFNQSYEGEVTRSTIMIRKIANNFRENQLYNIFIISLELLGHFSNNIKSVNFYDVVQHSIVNYGLRLTLACLLYDFIGTCGGEEVCDDMISVQVPTNWRLAFLSPTQNPDPVPLFYKLFHILPPEMGQLALSCLVQTASFRRSFFNSNERSIFLRQLVEGACEILNLCINTRNNNLSTTSAGNVVTSTANNNNIVGASNTISTKTFVDTDNCDCHHELCRLLCRLKSNFQLGELISIGKEYTQFIELLAKFTISSIQYDTGNKFAGSNSNNTDRKLNNSQHYLLLTWQRMIASLPYLRCNQPHLLDVYCPKIVEMYVTSRLQGCDVDDGNLEDWCNLEDGVGIPQELESFAMMARCQYSSTVQILARLFDQITRNSNQVQEIDITFRIRRLCWLVLFIGACISGRVSGTNFNSSGSACGHGSVDRNDNDNSSVSSTSPSSALDGDQLDGELVGRVLQLVLQGPLFNYSQLLNNSGDRSVVRSAMINALSGLEIAILHFLDQLRRVYLCGESSGRIARLYDVLQNRVTISNETDLLDTIIRKILDNLRLWSCANRAVVNRSLGLFHELTLGAVAKRAVQLPVIQLLLEQHSSSELPFLEANSLQEVSFGSGDDSLSARHNTDLYRTNAVPISNNNIGASSNPRTCFYACLTRILLLLGPKVHPVNNTESQHSGSRSGAGGDDLSCYSSLMSDDPRTSGILMKFLLPLTQAFNQINQLITNINQDVLLQQPDWSDNDLTQIRIVFLGLLRDIRGVTVACHSKAAYQALFDWLFPGVFSLLVLAIELLSSVQNNPESRIKDDGGIALGCLRVARELCLSRNNRLQSASPMGELVFRSGARILSTYANRRLQLNNNHMKSFPYSFDTKSTTNKNSNYLKLIRESTAALDLLYNMLSGNYANLGAFTLYQDESLEVSLRTFLQIMISIPPVDLLSFPKLSRAYYTIADVITQDHLIWLGVQQPQMILYFVNTITEGLSSSAVGVSSNCCSSLDNLSTFLLKITSTSMTISSIISNNTGTNSPQHTSPLDDQHRHGLRPQLQLPAILTHNTELHGSLQQLSDTCTLISSREAEARANWRYLLTSNNKIIPTSTACSIANGGEMQSELRQSLARAMELLLESLIQPDCKNQWALSRPLLTLILLDMKAYENLQSIIIAQRGGGDVLKTAFQKLMEDVNCTLTIRNRDKFTQNLNVFRHNLNGAINASSRSSLDQVSSNEMIG